MPTPGRPTTNGYNGGRHFRRDSLRLCSEKTRCNWRSAPEISGCKLHTANVERIRKGFLICCGFQTCHPGAYREQIGYKRLHESPVALMQSFCPIDAGLLDATETGLEYERLQFSEWGLERVKMPYGGDQCWPSQWVLRLVGSRNVAGRQLPARAGLFSSRFGDDGWKVLRGTFHSKCCFGKVPATWDPAGGTDFNDCNSMFAR